jgi:hypothetical protein
VIGTGRTLLATCAAAAALGIAAPAAQASLLGGLTQTVTQTVTPVVTVAPSTVTSVVSQVTTQTGGTLDAGQVTTVVTELLTSGVDAAVVTTVVDDVLAAAADPQAVEALVQQLVAGGLDAGVVPAVLDQVLAEAGVAPVLAQAAVAQAVAELLATGLPTDASSLQAALAALTAGTAPSASLLAPITAVLDALGANALLPADLQATVDGLATTLRSGTPGALTPTVTDTLASLLLGVSQQAAVPQPVKDVLAQLAGAIAQRPWTFELPKVPGGAGPGAGAGGGAGPVVLTAAMRARISRVAVDRARKVVRITLRCPAAAVFGCAVQSRARVGGKPVGAPVTTFLRPSQTTTVKVRLPAATTRTVRRRGGQVGARATTLLGTLKPTASRTTTVRKAAARGARKGR